MHTLSLDLGLTRDLLWVCFERLDDVLLAQEDPGALCLGIASKRKRSHTRQLPHGDHGVCNDGGWVEVC